MDQADSDLIEKQAQLEILAAKKALERKKQARDRADRPKVKGSDKPVKKKAKPSPPTLKFTAEHLEMVKTQFWTTLQYMPSLNKTVLFSGVTGEVMCFGAYPILIKEYNKKEGPLPIDCYLLGVTRPQIVLNVLRHLFAKAYPDNKPGDFNTWEVYRWNRAFYGSKIEASSYSPEYNALEILEQKPYGGQREVSAVNMKVESTLFRWKKYAQSVNDYIERRFSREEHYIQPVPPKGATPYPPDYLAKVAHKITDLKKMELSAAEKAKSAISAEEMREVFDNLQDESPENSDEDED